MGAWGEGWSLPPPPPPPPPIKDFWFVFKYTHMHCRLMLEYSADNRTPCAIHLTLIIIIYHNTQDKGMHAHRGTSDKGFFKIGHHLNKGHFSRSYKMFTVHSFLTLEERWTKCLFPSVFIISWDICFVCS